MALEIFRLIGSVFVDTGEAEKSLQKTDEKAEKTGKTLGEKLGGAAKTAGKVAVGFAGVVGAAGGAMVALTESTREYREEQGKLQTAFEAAGFASGAARSTYEALNGVLGDSGQAVEAANHLAQLCENEQQLKKWTDICTGVYATFGDSLPIEGLTEAANETAKTGALTGGLADALNWAGVSEEEFQARLDSCRNEHERMVAITSTLNGLYSETADRYRENSAEIIRANEAQDKMNAAMADAGAAMEPFVTAGKLVIAEVLSKLAPMLTSLAEFVLPLLSSALSAVGGWVSGLMAKVSESGFSFGNVMASVKAFFQDAMVVIQAVWTSVGQPVWDFLMLAVNLVKDLFMQNMPAIKEFVRSAFTDIKNIWQNNLQPALKAIGDFIQNVLAPAFKSVFENIIGPVVKNVFNGIKGAWNDFLKPALSGILDFITGVFSGNWKKAWDGIKSVFSGIVNGILGGCETLVNGAITAINGIINAIDDLAVVEAIKGALGINSLPNIPLVSLPRMARGGILERGQVGLLEGSGAEAVVPLENNKKWTRAVAQDMEAAMGGVSGGQVVALLTDILDVMAEIANGGIYLDGDALVGRLAKRMDNKLGQIQARKARA